MKYGNATEFAKAAMQANKRPTRIKMLPTNEEIERMKATAALIWRCRPASRKTRRGVIVSKWSAVPGRRVRMQTGTAGARLQCVRGASRDTLVRVPDQKSGNGRGRM
jgi:hypothetical protein